jgi:spermidine synthase
VTDDHPRPDDFGEEPAPSVERAGDELRLIVDGAVQSVAVGADETPRGYWRALLPVRRPASALILGLGGGTVVHLLRRQSRSIRITGVDDDPRVLVLARRHFGLEDGATAIVEADAREFVRRCQQHFDLVVVDLFRGEEIAGFVGQREFIRRIRSLVSAGGTLVWNLHRDRRGSSLRRRVGAGLRPDRRVLAGLNLVLHFRRRRRRLAGEDATQGGV